MVWLAVCLTAALVGDGWGRTSVVDRIMRKLDMDMVNPETTPGVSDGNKHLSNKTTPRTRMLDPFDLDWDPDKHAARFAGAKSLFGVKMKIGKKGFSGLDSKLKNMKGTFKKLHKNNLKDKAKASWNNLKKTWNKIPDKSKIVKHFLEEAWSMFGTFDLRDLIFAALSDLGLMPECTCYFTKEDVALIKKSFIGMEDEARGRLRCGCCIKPFDWKSLCVMVKVDTKTKAFEVSLEFDEEEFLVLPINFKKGDGAAPPKSACIPEHRLVIGQERCAYLGTLSFLDICVRPREIEIHKNGTNVYFGSCIQIVVDFLYYTYEKCFQFDMMKRQLSVVEDD